MKKIASLLAAFICIATICCAQRLKPNTIIKAQSASFAIKLDQFNNLIVSNSSNILTHKIPRVAPTNITSVERADKSGLLNAFQQVFSESRLQQLSPENIITMTLYVAPSGKVLEVLFILKKNTLVTALELEALEKAIKADVAFILRPDETKGGDFFAIGQVVKLSRVLDKTLK